MPEHIFPSPESPFYNTAQEIGGKGKISYECCNLKLGITESQNPRMVEVGRNLWRSTCPTLLLKQDHPEPVAQDHAQLAFEYPQGWRLHSTNHLIKLGIIIKEGTGK